MLQLPSVIESPKPTIVPVAELERTSIAFSQKVEVVVRVKAAADSSAATLPEPLSLRYDVTFAPACWLGRTSASGMYRLTARSWRVMTRIGTGSLSTVPPGARVTPGEPPKLTGRLEPDASAAPRMTGPT